MANERLDVPQELAAFKKAIEDYIQEIRKNPPVKPIPFNLASGSLSE